MCDQATKRKFIYRFLPTSLVVELIFELLVLRPAQEVIARLICDKPMEDRLRYRLFPGLYQDLTTETLTDALRKYTFDHLGYEVGISHWRKAQATLCDRFWDYHPREIDIEHYAQRGHGEVTGRAHYTGSDDAPTDTPGSKISKQLGASRCWQDLAGVNPRSRVLMAWLTSASNRHRTLVG